MADIQNKIVIEKPVEEVFSFASNLENSSKIMANVVEIEKLTDGPINVGSRYKETREIRGRTASSTIEFTEYTPNKSYAVKSEANGLKVVYYYNFQTVPEGTKVEFKGDIYTSGLVMKLTKPIIRRILKKEDADHLKHLKRVLEEGS
ncbi:SRPBCC family protein [Sutcliffiella deserti]|uniref:SRPBCC family protein n=1 Tax=Sutcliffiella deserti TaxID=2875501 RepID=UPI001CBBF7C6|nr:SRPBCC family protein [Sutcliffiella deserti]